MKIAFVSYPTATLLPPYYGSMGASTYMNASSLAKSCEVVVYGLEDKQYGAKSGVVRGVYYHFLPSAGFDQLLLKIRYGASRLIQFSSPISTSSWLFRAFGQQVAEELQKQECDIIHVQHCPQYVPVIRSLNPRAKIVLHLHAEMFSQMNFPLLARQFRDVDLLFTVSDYVTRKTRRDFPEIADRCETMHDAIDVSEFTREKDYCEASRRKEKRILYAGGVWPHKGPHVLLDALKIIVDRYPQVHLDIVGPQGDYPLEECFDLNDRAQLSEVAPLFSKNLPSVAGGWPRLRRADAGTYLSYVKSKLSADIADKVTFHGFVSRPDLIDQYYNADIFVFPPIWNEAFGCTPLEAMAAGTPVVASRSGGILETVKDQETGFLVEKNDARGLAGAALKLLGNDDLREAMGRAGRQRAFEHFNWDVVAEAMRDRYEALCGARTSAVR